MSLACGRKLEYPETQRELHSWAEHPLAERKQNQPPHPRVAPNADQTSVTQSCDCDKITTIAQLLYTMKEQHRGIGKVQVP